MRLPDTNVLIFASNRQSRCHDLARDWLERSAQAPGGLGLTWVVLTGFVRRVTRATIMPEPLAPADALHQVRQWLQHPAVRLLQPGERHLDILSRLLLEAGTAGNLTTDAHIAAIAIEHHAEVLTFDRDFTRFSGLRCQLLA